MKDTTEADAERSAGEDSMVRVLPPVAVLTAPSTCWKCGSKLSLVGLCTLTAINADGDTYGGSGEHDGLVLLMYIEQMPDILIRAMAERGSTLERMFSNTYEGEYFANRCVCGAIQGDHFLHRPGGPFWPENVEEATAIGLEWLPIQDELRIACGMSWTDSTVADYVRARRPTLKQ